MNTKLKLVALFVALFVVAVPAAQADGDVFYQGNHNFGASVFAPGNANFFFGSNNGGPALFQGSAFTGTGFSSIFGQVGVLANAFVPDGTKGSAQAGGNFSYQFGANHGNFPNTSFSSSVNTFSSSTGTGNASSNVFLQGNANTNPPLPPAPPCCNFPPVPSPVPPVFDGKG